MSILIKCCFYIKAQIKRTTLLFNLLNNKVLFERSLESGTVGELVRLWGKEL